MTTEFNNYIVKDISLAEMGRKDIGIMESKLPNHIFLREEFGRTQPLKGARIAGPYPMTIRTVVLIETLMFLGAEVRWASCIENSTQDHAAVALL